MTTTALGLCEGFAEAQRVTQTLVAQGIPSDDITIIANREGTTVGDVLVAAAWGVHIDVGPASRREPAALIALGVPADEAREYAMVLDGGGALVSVGAAEDQVDQVLEFMERYTVEEWAVPVAPGSPLT
jgi:hypothetical protein